MSEDRAARLAWIADEFMAGRDHMLAELKDGCRCLSVEVWPHEDPVEVHFTAEWPGVTLVASRSLAGYSLEGGLHKIGQSSPAELLGRSQRGRRSR